MVTLSKWIANNVARIQSYHRQSIHLLSSPPSTTAHNEHGQKSLIACHSGFANSRLFGNLPRSRLNSVYINSPRFYCLGRFQFYGVNQQSILAANPIFQYRTSASLPHRSKPFKRIWNSLRHFLKKGGRPWTMDDFWAVFSWLFIGQGVFILIGTTTFASVLLLLANSLQFNEYVAKKIGMWLTSSTGLTVSFGSAEPNWRDGLITFKNIHVVCGEPPEQPQQPESRNDNYSRFDIVIDRADISISLKRYLEGHGLAQTCEVVGVRGIVDRSKVHPIAEWRHVPQPGDFELENVKIKDMLINVINPAEKFRPYKISILTAEIPKLRKRCLLLDLLHAEAVVGMFDGSLFSMHVPQFSEDDKDALKLCRFMRHLKMDGVKVDHFSLGAAGPAGWLKKGTVDVDTFIRLPTVGAGEAQDDVKQIIGGFATTFETFREKLIEKIIKQEEQSSHPQGQFDDTNEELFGVRRRLRSIYPILSDRLSKRWRNDVLNVDDEGIETPGEAAAVFAHADPNTVVFKVDLKFRNIRADVPFPTPDLSYMNNALIRPIVAYINEHRPYIPISCHFILPVQDFDGAWSIYESGIAAKLSEGVTESFVLLVSDRDQRIKRLKRVGLWSLVSAVKQMSSLITSTLRLDQPAAYMLY